jgi:GNAT superfamily N-acetyltransferase
MTMTATDLTAELLDGIREGDEFALRAYADLQEEATGAEALQTVEDFRDWCGVGQIGTDALHIRWMIRRHYKQVLATDRQSFANPINEEDLVSLLRCANSIGMVAEVPCEPGTSFPEADSLIVGWMSYDLYTDHLLVTRFAVHPIARGCGVGRSMMHKLKSKLSSHRRTRVVVTPDIVTEESIPFLTACGFEERDGEWVYDLLS